MFTYEDYLNIFAFLKNGTTTGVDPNTQTLSLSEQAKTNNFFTETIDQISFASEDYKRLRAFLIDWYSSNKTLVTTQKNASDIYSLPDSHINELFYCFGFDIGNAIKNIPSENKINFFYDLINLYKVKGTPYSLFKALNYFGIPSIELYEYWLLKDNSGNLVLRGEPVLSTPGVLSLGHNDIDFKVTLDDPHWFYTEAQINSLLATNDIRLPSKTPYYGIRPTYSNNITSTIIYISRKCQDDYSTWISTGSLTRDIKCSLGFMTSFLELYLGCIYTFRSYYNPTGYDIGNFLCYDGTSLPSYTIVNNEYSSLTTRAISRNDFKTRLSLVRNLFTRPIYNNFLSYYPSGPGSLLEIMYPEFKTEIDFYLTASKQEEVIRLLFSDLGLWLRQNLGTLSSSLPSYVLDFESYASNYIDKVSNFFKPYHARLLFTEKVYKIGTALEDSCVVEDGATTDNPIPITIQVEFFDYDTADSDPGFLYDSTALTWYTREHFDCGSYFDIGASIDEEISINISDSYNDYLNIHTSDSTTYIHYGYTLDSSSNVIYAYQDGGFTNYDEGGYYDSPFISDICQITVIDSTPPDTYSDIVFWWRGKGSSIIIPDYGESSVVLFEPGSSHYSTSNDYNPLDETPTFTQQSYPLMADSSIMDFERGWVLRFLNYIP